MKKINIVKKNKEYSEIIKLGKKVSNKYLIIYFTKNELDNYYFGFSVSKKLGNAVLRNKIKRQLKNILDKKTYKKGFKCIIMIKKEFISKEFEEKTNILYDLINQLDIIDGEK
jgi:ribonuclease P protein component